MNPTSDGAIITRFAFVPALDSSGAVFAPGVVTTGDAGADVFLGEGDSGVAMVRFEPPRASGASLALAESRPDPCATVNTTVSVPSKLSAVTTTRDLGVAETIAAIFARVLDYTQLMSSASLEVACPNCQQVLVLKLDNLQAIVQCPRCHAEATTASLVPVTTPVPAKVKQGSSQVPAGTNTSPPGTNGSKPVASVDAKASFPIRVIDALGEAMDILPRVNAVAYGRRTVLVAIASAVLLATSLLNPLAYKITLCVYLLFLWTLSASWFWCIRDEEGVWTWSNIFRHISSALFDALVNVIDQFPPTGSILLKYLFNLSFIAAVLGTVVAGVLEPISDWLPEARQLSSAASTISIVGVGGGVLASLIGLWRLYSDAKKKAQLRNALRPLPKDAQRIVLDLRKKSDATDQVPKMLRPIIASLAAWKPRKFPNEAGYATDLRRHLVRSLRVDVEREVVLQNTSRKIVGRVDIVVDKQVALELKCNLQGTQADRAVGQVLKYVEHWQTGPVLLVVCEAPAAFDTSAETARIIEATSGRAVVIAAGNQ